MGGIQNEYILLFKYLLFTIVVASIPTTSKLSTSTSSGTDDENKIDYETDLSTVDTDMKIDMDTSTWSTADKKKTPVHDRILPRISVCFQRGSLHQDNNDKKNISYESPHV